MNIRPSGDFLTFKEPQISKSKSITLNGPKGLLNFYTGWYHHDPFHSEKTLRITPKFYDHPS